MAQMFENVFKKDLTMMIVQPLTRAEESVPTRNVKTFILYVAAL